MRWAPESELCGDVSDRQVCQAKVSEVVVSAVETAPHQIAGNGCFLLPEQGLQMVAARSGAPAGNEVISASDAATSSTAAVAQCRWFAGDALSAVANRLSSSGRIRAALPYLPLIVVAVAAWAPGNVANIVIRGI